MRGLRKEVIAAVPSYVERTIQLSRLSGHQYPSVVTNSYLQEATRTYVFGFAKASIALSRAALEQSLKEGLGYHGTRVFVQMNDLLDEAESAGVIDRTIRKVARKVADEADEVLHQNPKSLAQAYDVLIAVRGVFQHIYSDR